MVLTAELVQVVEELIDTHADLTARSTAVATWRRVLTDFSSLIGPTLHDESLRRCVRKHRLQLAWLSQVEVMLPHDKAIDAMSKAMSTRSVSEVVYMTRNLLGTYIDMMNALLGSRVVERVIYRIASKRYIR